MKNKLKVEVSSGALQDDAVVIDGYGILHSLVYRPKEGLLKDLVKSVEYCSSKLVDVADAYLLFDHYLKAA